MNRGTGSSKKQNLPVVFQVAVSNLLPEHAQRADLFELTGLGSTMRLLLEHSRVLSSGEKSPAASVSEILNGLLMAFVSLCTPHPLDPSLSPLLPLPLSSSPLRVGYIGLAMILDLLPVSEGLCLLLLQTLPGTAIFTYENRAEMCFVHHKLYFYLLSMQLDYIF